MIAYTKVGMSCHSGWWSSGAPITYSWGDEDVGCRNISPCAAYCHVQFSGTSDFERGPANKPKKYISAKNFLLTGESFPARTVVFMSTTTRFHGQGLVQTNLGTFWRQPNGQNATPEPHLQARDIGAEEWRKFSCTSRSLALVTMLVVEDIRLDLDLQGNKISAWIRERQTK